MLTDDAIQVIIKALFDIRTELRWIRALLEDEDGEEGNEAEDS